MSVMSLMFGGFFFSSDPDCDIDSKMTHVSDDNYTKEDATVLWFGCVPWDKGWSRRLCTSG